MLEKQIEKEVCFHAKQKGFLTYKFTSPSRSAVPDRLLITPWGTVFFIEFKRTGEEPTPQQHREHDRLRKMNILLFVVDNIPDGKKLIDGIWERISTIAGNPNVQ